jgi:cation diffusion facilitator CzcD-associated flavoprotein CzcO
MPIAPPQAPARPTPDAPVLHDADDTLIIGAGPAGLAMAGRLAAAGLPFRILERDHRIAPSWQDHYERLHLHTVKGCSNLPHRPFPDEAPRYIPRAELVAYYEAYARDFGIRPLFGQEVTRVAPSAEGHWRVDTRSDRFRAARVVVCTGFNRLPVEPAWPGQARFGGEIRHSRHYRNGKAYRDRRVLVVGMGNTGAEIALDLAEHGARPTLAVRGPVNIVPRDFLGRSTQESSMTFSRLPHALGDALGRVMQRLTIGDLSRCGLRPAGIAPARQLREEGRTPVMDVGTVAAIKAGRIAVRPGPEAFSPGHVRFTDGREEPFDAVVLATGFRSAVEEFVTDAEPLFNRHGVPRAPWFEQRPGLYFLGFDAYSSGLLWRIREDSGAILEHIRRGERPKAETARRMAGEA